MKFVAATLLIASVIAVPALKASEPASDRVHPLMPMTVIGSSENIQTIAGSGDYIDLQELRAQNHDDINRILRKVPGVYVREEDGYGLFPNISLRGVDPGRASKVTIMEDGVLAAPAPYSAPAAYYAPTAGRMSAIEVLKGSSQVRFGPQTSGGVINYLSTPVPSEATGLFRGLYGTDGELRNHLYYGNVLDLASGRLGYLLEYYERSVDGFKTIDETIDYTARDRTGFQKREPMLKLFWEPLSERYQRFEIKLGYTDMVANETYMGLSDEDFARDAYRRYAGSRFDQIETEQFRSHLRHAIELSPDIRLTTTAYYSEFERDWYKERTKGTDIADPERMAVLRGETAGTLNYRSNFREYTSGGVEMRLDASARTGRATHQVEAGLRLHQDDVRRFQRDDTFVQNANGAIVDRIIGAPGSGGNRKEESEALAVYIQDAAGVGRWTLIPGVRYERVDLRYKDYDTKGQPDKLTGRGDTTLDIVAPGLGVIAEIDDETSVFGGVYRGYSLPGPRAAAKDGLKEETSIGYELGVRRQAEGIRAEGILFYTDFENLIVPDIIGAGGSLLGSENAGDVITYGLETRLAYDPGSALGWGFSNPWYIGATWTRAEIDSDTPSLNEESLFAGGRKGNRVPYIPELQLAIGTGLETLRWGAFLDLQYVDGAYTTASNVRESVDPGGNPNSAFGRTDAHVLVDLSGHIRLTDNARLIASAHNLFDETYVAARHPAGARPGRPRTLLAGVEVKF